MADDSSRTQGGNPAKDDKKAGAGAKPAGQDLARANAAEVQSGNETPPAETTVGDAELVKADDADGLESLLSEASGEQFVSLDKDVVEEFFYPDTKRPSHRVLFHKGQVVARSVIEQRAAAIRAAQDTSPAARIDATTLASGTFPGIEAATS